MKRLFLILGLLILGLAPRLAFGLAQEVCPQFNASKTPINPLHVILDYGGVMGDYSPTLTMTPSPTKTNTVAGWGAALSATPSPTPTLTSTHTMTKTYTPEGKVVIVVFASKTNTPIPWCPSASMTSTLTPNSTNIVASCTHTKTPLAQDVNVRSMPSPYTTAVHNVHVGNAVANAQAVRTALPLSVIEAIVHQPTATITPTWVPSMTPSPTLSPTPYIVQNLQSARPITLSVSAFGNGGTILGSSATLLGVPESFYICRAPAPDGLGGPTTYQFWDGFGPGFMGFNAPTNLNSSALMYTRTGSGSVIQVGAVNVTPTPNITPSPCIVIIQPRY